MAAAGKRPFGLNLSPPTPSGTAVSGGVLTYPALASDWPWKTADIKDASSTEPDRQGGLFWATVRHRVRLWLH
jgi:hypothetical protein